MRPSKYRRRDNKALGISDFDGSPEACNRKQLKSKRAAKRSSVKNMLRKFSGQISSNYDENFLEDLIDYDMILDG